MCGILFKSNFYSKCDNVVFKEALNTLSHRGPDEEGILYTPDFSFGHKRLVIRDITNGKQPISVYNKHLIYNGEIYNSDLLKDKLDDDINCHSDSVLLMNLLNKYNTKALDMINGIFGFVYTDGCKVLAARDRIGIKPLYYSIYNDDIIIASEIKAILKYKGEAVVDKTGLCELLGLLPSHSPGNTLYKDIFELKPGHYLLFDRQNGLRIEKYYDLSPKKYNMSLEDTKSLVKNILFDSIKSQMVSDVGITSFLSGGVDSSIIVGVMKEMKGNLATYSISYEDNKKDFIKNSFETSLDEDYVGLMNTNHKSILVDNTTLIDYLKTAVILRDGPGMTDIDASLYYLARNVKKDFSVSMSGECSDEIFGGYPWYYKDDKYDIFPWIRNLDYRSSIINKDLGIDIKKYVRDKYNEVIEETPILKSDSDKRIKERQMYYLNTKYFMQALIDRHDRMTMGAGLEVRVPFADYRLVELLYNVPFEYKYYNNVEKALLRDSMKEFIPEGIYKRKKSPYPKSRSKKYSKMVKKLLCDTLNDKDSILYTLFDYNALMDLCNKDDELDVPWYGQLMRLDQLRAFLYQIDYWFKEYNIKLEL